MKETVQSFLNRRVLVLPKTATVRQAARALYENRVGCAVVSDKRGHVVGLVTDRDLATLILGFALPSSTAVSDVMATNVKSVSSKSRIADVLDVMEAYGIRRVPVIEKTKQNREKCVGIVTLDDLLASGIVDASTVGNIVRAQIARRWKNMETRKDKEDRKSHTLSRFVKRMSEGLGLDKKSSDFVSTYFLKQIVLRLKYTAAAHFISQLPSLKHEELFAFKDENLDQRDFPDFIEGVMEEFQIGRAEAIYLCQSFWSALEEIMDAHLLMHVLEALPKEMRTYFRSADRDYTPPLMDDGRFFIPYI